MKNLHKIFLCLCCLWLMTACASHLEEGFTPDAGISDGSGNNLKPIPGKNPEDKDRHVLLLYMAGYNSLFRFIKADIEDILTGWLPRKTENDNVLLIYAHLAEYGNYNRPISPVLMRVTRDDNDETSAVVDTLVVYDKNTISSSPEQMNDVLTYVKESFEADHYGLTFSSHSTGFLPVGYTSINSILTLQSHGQIRENYGSGPVPYTEFIRDSFRPEVKSIGSDRVGEFSHEMELTDFAECIPFKLDYIMFDTCLMGGIEVAYELKDKCDMLAFSQTEILAEGFNYKTLVQHLLGNKNPSLIDVCKDYFDYYNAATGMDRSATISLVDCKKLDELAKTCKSIFANNRDGLASIDYYSVQRYHDIDWPWFYDMEDIIVKAGAGSAELESLRAALDKCVIYKAHTPSFMNLFDINTHCGFSMYIPASGSAYLNRFYKGLQWNKATSLVE